MQQDPETRRAERRYFISGGEDMAENINIALAIIVSLVTIFGALCGVLIFVWRTSGNLTGVLNNLNNGIARLNEHLTRVEERADKTDLTLAEYDEQLGNHETRITILEKWKDGEL